MRQFDYISLPLSKGVALLHPENVVLQWSQNAVPTLDVGSLCYLERDCRSTQRKMHSFTLSSFSHSRAAFVKRLVTHCSTVEEAGEHRGATSRNHVKCLKEFLDWVDGKGNKGLYGELHTQGEWLNALHDWVKLYLKTRVAQSYISVNTATLRERNVINLLRKVFQDDRFGERLFGGRYRKSAGTPTEVPADDTQHAILSVATNLFEGLCDLLLNHKPYPFRVEMNQSKAVARGYMWFFCGRGERDPLVNPAYDFDTGRLYPFHAVKERSAAAGRTSPSYSLRDAKLALKQVNIETFGNPGTVRILHARLACLCFAAIFLFETSANIQTMLDMEWDESIKKALDAPEVKIHRSREVKWRAGGKLVTVEVSHGFLPKFKRYLALREYILQGKKLSSLFVTTGGVKRERVPTRLPAGFVTRLYGLLDTQGLTLPRMSARQFRAAGLHYWLTHYGLAAAAAHGGNTPDTVKRRYANGTAVDQRNDWTPILQSMALQTKGMAEEAVLRGSEELPGSLSIAVGLCSKQNSPASIMVEPPVTPDCGSSQGCLFCKRYRVHANASDMRKLLSARHCISAVSRDNLSTLLSETVFGKVMFRIDSLLEELKGHDEHLFLSIKSDVEQSHNLDPFWAGKLMQLAELGLI